MATTTNLTRIIIFIADASGSKFNRETFDATLVVTNTTTNTYPLILSSDQDLTSDTDLNILPNTPIPVIIGDNTLNLSFGSDVISFNPPLPNIGVKYFFATGYITNFIRVSLDTEFTTGNVPVTVPGSSETVETVTLLASCPNPGKKCNPVTFTARVAAIDSSIIQSGTITFSFDNGLPSVTQNVDSTGTAVISQIFKRKGKYNVTATFNGAGNFLASSSSIVQIIKSRSDVCHH